MISRQKHEKALDSTDLNPDEVSASSRRKYVVDTIWFNLLMGAIIILNGLILGLQTDSPDRDAPVWGVIELMFCAIYVIEFLMRLRRNGREYFTAYREGLWNTLDTCVVFATMANAVILEPAGFEGAGHWVSLLRSARVLRVIRVIRMMSKNLEHLSYVTKGLMQATKVLLWLSLVMFIFLYMCAIVATHVVGHNDRLYDAYFVTSGGWDHEVYFATVPRSLFTLFQVFTRDNWSDGVVRHVVAEQPLMIFFFVFFMLVATYGLINIAIAVIVESIFELAEADQDVKAKSKERDRQKVLLELRDIFDEADTDHSGMLTLDEVEWAIRKPEVYLKLKKIDFPVDDPKKLFELLDYDDSGELSTEEFITGCIRMRGDARSKDLLVAQVAVDSLRRHFTIFGSELGKCRERLEMLETTTQGIIGQGEHLFLDEREYRLRHPDHTGAYKPSTTGVLTTMPWDEAPPEHTAGRAPKTNSPWATHGATGILGALNRSGHGADEYVADGTVLVAHKDTEIWVSPSSWEKLQKIERGQTVTAAGPLELVGEHEMVLVYPRGAVQLNNFDIRKGAAPLELPGTLPDGDYGQPEAPPSPTLR